MKHPFIIFGSLGAAVVLGAAAWIYFMLFYTHSAPAHSAPNPFTEASSTKGFDALAQERAAEVGTTTPGQVASSGGARLLTLRKSLAAVALQGETYRFVEAGTGHIYQTDTSGTETKISGTTFPGVRQAVWSKEGTRVALIQETESGAFETFAGVLQKNDAGAMTLEGSIINSSGENISFSELGDTLFSTRPTLQGGTEGIAVSLKTKKTQTLFTTPLRNTVVWWEPSIIISTRPSAVLPGFAYTKDGIRITDSMNAFSEKEMDDATLFSGESGGTLTSWIRIGSRTTLLSRGVIPEKCTRKDFLLVCAIPSSFENAGYPDLWYRGEISYSDSLWQFDMQSGSSTLLFDFETTTKKPIDVRSIAITADGYLLEGKTDGSLWFVQNRAIQRPQ